MKPQSFHRKVSAVSKQLLNERFCYWCNKYHPLDQFGSDKRKCLKAQQQIELKGKQ